MQLLKLGRFSCRLHDDVGVGANETARKVNNLGKVNSRRWLVRSNQTWQKEGLGRREGRFDCGGFYLFLATD